MGLGLLFMESPQTPDPHEPLENIQHIYVFIYVYLEPSYDPIRDC